jgi:aminoglycoside phosphotransferase (APT) family kinase protein
MLSEEELTRLGHHLVKVTGAKSLHMTHIKRYHGGASRETYGIDAEIDGQQRGLIVRRDPVDSLIETERSVEYAAYRSFEDSVVPVPRMICLEDDVSIIGAPFFVMERIDGGEPGSPFDPNSYEPHRTEIGRQFFDLLGHIHACAAEASPLAEVIGLPSPGSCWQIALDHWANEIEKDAQEPQPIGLAAIRWLRRNGPPPPPKRLCIVHGDYRTGNVLHDGAGKIIAVLDWEMAHIGDPHEDLAWALDPIWNAGDPAFAGGLIPRDEALALWSAASGIAFDADAFRWWEMFATVKGLGIWISAARALADGANSDPILAFSGFYPLAHANQLLASRLAAWGEAT